MFQSTKKHCVYVPEHWGYCECLSTEDIVRAWALRTLCVRAKALRTLIMCASLSYLSKGQSWVWYITICCWRSKTVWKLDRVSETQCLNILHTKPSRNASRPATYAQVRFFLQWFYPSGEECSHFYWTGLRSDRGNVILINFYLNTTNPAGFRLVGFNCNSPVLFSHSISLHLKPFERVTLLGFLFSMRPY